MTSIRLPRLSRPGVLESIAPHRLVSLQPYSTFSLSRGVSVIRTAMDADRDTPAKLQINYSAFSLLIAWDFSWQVALQ